MIEEVAKALRLAVEKRQWNILFETYPGEVDPFRVH